MPVNADEFLNQCREIAVTTYMSNKNWTLDYLGNTAMTGLLIYFMDMDTGYMQIVSLHPETDISFTNTLSMEEIVAAVGFLLERIHAKRGNQQESLVNLARAIGVYALRTQTFLVTKDKLGSSFSLYIMARGAKKEYFELRPFASSKNTIESPDSARESFRLVANKFDWPFAEINYE